MTSMMLELILIAALGVILEWLAQANESIGGQLHLSLIHIDVYKRQVQHRRNLCPQGIFYGFKLLLPGLLSGYGKGCVCKVAVSYTHLDVYKRQSLY